MSNAVFFAVTLALAAGLSLNARATLSVGEFRPPQIADRQIRARRDAALTEFAPGKAYVVEFWATLVRAVQGFHSLTSTKKHTKFKDKGLIVIGQDCWEQDESLVAPFVRRDYGR